LLPLEALKKECRREDFHALVHAHLFEIEVAGNKNVGPCVDGQGNELVIRGVPADGHLGQHLKVLHGLGNFDQVLQAA
jgi:hypothetical protein